MCSHGGHTGDCPVTVGTNVDDNDLEYDVTLRSCCERDLAEQRKIEGYKKTLLKDDPTSRRVRIAQQAVIRNPSDIPQTSDDECEDLDTEDDDEILGMLLDFPWFRLCRVGQRFKSEGYVV
jgi:hypothetical protein